VEGDMGEDPVEEEIGEVDTTNILKDMKSE